MRMEGSSGDRRSHDGHGGHFGGSYGSRQESYGERRDFGGERRRSPSRDGYRKGMGPPRTPPAGRPTARPRTSLRAPRRSFRGRTLRSRGSYRGSTRSRGSFAIRRPVPSRSLDYIRKQKIAKLRSSIKAKAPDSGSSTEAEDWDPEENVEVKEETKDVKQKSPKKDTAEAGEVSEGEVAEGSATDKEGVEGGSDDGEGEAVSKPAYTKNYISLVCTHCKEKCLTFKAYSRHLLTSKHRAAMGAVAGKHKTTLLRMRATQRVAQRDLELDQDAELAARSAFCLICKLNHRTTRHAHNLSEAHRAMKRFLMPFCRICRLTFRSPMTYEHHICSLDHIKKKSRHDSRSAASAKVEDPGSADEGMDVDLENFMTLDSVGDVDEVDEDSGAEKKEDDGAEKKPKVEINIGSEHIKKVEVYWCELCKTYVSRGAVAASPTAAEEALRRHCRLRTHLGRYVRHRDNRTLRRHAERIHRQLHKQKDADKEQGPAEANKNGDQKAAATEGANEGEPTVNLNGTGDDKLWADVDKDLGDLLREVDPTSGNKSSDDEEDSGRYDKFRKSDKKIVDKTTEVVAEVTPAAEAETATATPAPELAQTA